MKVIIANGHAVLDGVEVQIDEDYVIEMVAQLVKIGFSHIRVKDY